MAYTQTDLDAIKSAIASGERLVRFSDGRTVEYRDTPDLLRAQRAIQAELSPTTTRRLSPRYQQADFSDG